mmetsp:Transcript_10670/g.29609  ORF Transcript_10670/g.29609 Transcript_10670/m.29609 type:complete len:200 (+) Transcript_10670:435-1034(+)
MPMAKPPHADATRILAAAMDHARISRVTSGLFPLVNNFDKRGRASSSPSSWSASSCRSCSSAFARVLASCASTTGTPAVVFPSAWLDFLVPAGAWKGLAEEVNFVHRAGGLSKPVQIARVTSSASMMPVYRHPLICNAVGDHATLARCSRNFVSAVVCTQLCTFSTSMCRERMSDKEHSSPKRCGTVPSTGHALMWRST